MKKKTSKTLFIVLIIVLILLSLLAIKIITTGKVVSGGEKYPSKEVYYEAIQYNNTANCNDSDSGSFSLIPGKVSYKSIFTRTYSDKCGEKDKNRESLLTEYFCKDGKVQGKTITCKYSCNKTACLTHTFIISSSGNDKTGDGSKNKPLASIIEALNRGQEGDIIVFASDDLENQLRLTITAPTSKSNNQAKTNSQSNSGSSKTNSASEEGAEDQFTECKNVEQEVKGERVTTPEEKYKPLDLSETMIFSIKETDAITEWTEGTSKIFQLMYKGYSPEGSKGRLNLEACAPPKTRDSEGQGLGGMIKLKIRIK